MGLDVSHGAWCGSYGSFMTFRIAVAKAMGFELRRMSGYGTARTIAGIVGPPIEWESIEYRPIHELLNHSDCDGEIAADKCAAVADDLQSLLPMIDDEWVLMKAERFIEGLRNAAQANEPLEFE